MRTLCVIFGAVLLLFSGICILHYQQPLKEVTFSKMPALGSWFDDLNSESKFSVSSLAPVEPRSLID